MTVAAISMSFEKRYSDGSGVEFAVRLNRNDPDRTIELTSQASSAYYPIEQLQWIMECLSRIEDELIP